MRKVILTLFLVALSCVACEKGTQEGEIYGTVSDRGFDGKPVAVVNLVLSPGGKSTVTGSDGRYVFSGITPGDNYSIHYSKQGYIDGDAGNISVAAGTRTQVDIQIEMQMEALEIDKKDLDFGSNSQNNTLSFNIQNKYSQALGYEIINNCGWISKVSPNKGTLPYGSVASIVVVIDRELLSVGENSATIILITDIGSYDLKVKATRVSDYLPSLNVLDATEIHATEAVLNAQIIDDGAPHYTARGFLISESSAPAESNSRIVNAIITEERTFSAGVNALVLGKTYYVKAFAENAVGKAYSSNIVSFTTTSTMPKVETLQPTNIDDENKTVVFMGRIIEKGDPVFSECGFVYSNIYQYPTVDDNKAVVENVSGVDVYDKRVTLTGDLYSYYVRAYAKNEQGQIAYGEPKKVSNPDYFDIPGTNLSVQTKDIGCGDQNSMANLCSNSAVGGFTVWRLPTLEELGTLYEWREAIGGFITSSSGSHPLKWEYWSSSPADKPNYYYYIDFRNGNYGKGYSSSSDYPRSARCVRNTNQK